MLARKGDKLFPDAEIYYPINSLSSVIAAKICFENALKGTISNDPVYYKLLHNQAMTYIRLFELNKSIKLFSLAAPHIKESDNSLKIIKSIETNFQLDKYLDSYREEKIYSELFSKNKITPIRVTEEEAEYFKFTETELKDLVQVTEEVKHIAAKSENPVIIPIGRSPLWITEILHQSTSLRVIPVSFSLLHKKYEASLEKEDKNDLEQTPWMNEEIISYIYYLKSRLSTVSLTDDVYILDYIGTGRSAYDFSNLLRTAFINNEEVSTLEGRIHLIGLNNPALRHFDSIREVFLKDNYTSVNYIDLPPSLDFLAFKNSYYKFVFLPYIAFYPQDWVEWLNEVRNLKREPDSFIPVETKVINIRRNQIKGLFT